MTGIPISKLKSSLRGKDIHYIRTVPNTALMVGKGVSGVYLENYSCKPIIEDFLGPSSKIIYLDSEALLDQVTAISGSGIAYYIAFMEALRDAGIALGFSHELSTQMATGTALGAAELVTKSPESLETLRKNVTSPGGTTQQALDIFAKGNLPKLVSDAAFAAYRRSKEMEYYCL